MAGLGGVTEFDHSPIAFRFVSVTLYDSLSMVQSFLGKGVERFNGFFDAQIFCLFGFLGALLRRFGSWGVAGYFAVFCFA